MPQIKTYLIDDEPDAIEQLAWLLNTYCPNVEVVGSAHHAEKAIKDLSELNPDIVFLDIEMPEVNGFELLEYLPGKPFKVIFATAYSQHILRAIRASAFDYLLKPIDQEELQHCLQRYVKQKDVNVDGQYELLTHNIKTKDPQKNKIALHSTQGFDVVEIDHILYGAAEGKYLRFFTCDNQEFLVSTHLKVYENTLSDYHFFRIHYSYLVNMNHIVAYKNKTAKVVLSNGTELPVSVRRKDDFLSCFKAFMS